MSERLPLRARLVAGFVVAITVVLTAAGAFVYWRVAYALDARLDSDLRAETAALAPLVGPSGTLAVDPVLPRVPGAHAYQVLDAGGRVLSAGSDVPSTPLLSLRQVRAAQQHEVLADVGALLPASRRPLRLLAVPLPGSGTARVLVVAERRDQRDEALRELLGQLALAGLFALLVTAVVGERLAKAALAPVERYRSRAEQIAGGARGIRLDVPPLRHDEVTRLGQTLNTMLDALESALDRERRFTQDASHELRTPLTLLSTRVQLALRRPRTAAEHEAVLRELGEDVAALSALADALLEVSTTDATGAAEGTADLQATVEAVVREHPGVSTTGGAPAARVRMPEHQLRQVVANLLANSLAHGAPPVRVSAAVHGGIAVLAVGDAGDGVDPEFLPQAVERFARADVARARVGAGLGLALVDGLVQRAGGDLRLCSRGTHHRYSDRFDLPCDHPEDGTTATVLLPLA
ncbi:signal transduction histidine kinase [Motilibacter rhizosphaerae]|uniref:histidine kinase n=1 Tax=Motilibacter rhizosphaerae TaxID=598652 RepID=A0A4V2F3D2_9ACTN|nr:ATP-binding protein [Motilibacter rhizosphaerae]RZS82703.1 signal transduction histidine kinase [Motilibacter rhizosphaerae]